MIWLAIVAVLVVGYVVMWKTTPYSYIIVRRDVPPYNPSVTTTLGHKCQAPCVVEVFTPKDFDLTLSAPGYVSHTIHMSIPRYADGSLSEFQHQPSQKWLANVEMQPAEAR